MPRRPPPPLKLDLTSPEYLARPIMLDLFCGSGGAAFGYYLAGFRVIGVDTDPYMLREYPFECYRFDALDLLDLLLANGAGIRQIYAWNGIVLSQIAVIHASPPCEGYSATARIGNSSAAMLIPAVRRGLLRTRKPYIIENVPEARAELWRPIMLCGAMFPELRVYRHRLFETNFPVKQPPHPEHRARQPKMGRPVADGDFIQVVGHFSNVAYARAAMGISWMTRNQLNEAIPPAYTHYVGEFALDFLNIIS